MRLQNYMMSHPQNVKNLYTKIVSPTKRFSVLERMDGQLFVETETIDEENITTIEVLLSRDGKKFRLMWREREGENHNEMRTYERDEKYPLYKEVNLNVS